MHTNLREANAARQALWDKHDQSANMDWRKNELAGEVGELCNVLKKLHRARVGMPGSRATNDELADELADVIICLDLLLMTGSYRPSDPGIARVPNRPLAQWGGLLFSAVGRLFTVLSFGVPNEVEPCADHVHKIIASIAENEKIDLPMAVENKFNHTSRKMGFAVLLTGN